MTTEEHQGRAAATRGRLRSVLLDVGALLGVLCLVAGIASMAFDVRPLVFRSGSMSPEIRTGAVALARDTDAADLRVGDVVSVTNAAGTRITHRIVELQGTGATRILTLKGDDNEAADDETYPVVRTPRVFAHLNGAGYVVSWLSSPPAVFAGGLLSGVLLMLVRGGGRRPGPGGRRRGPGAGTSRRTGAAVTTGLAALLVLGTATGALVARPASTLAAFTDASTAASSFSATTVQPPASTACSNQGGVLGLLGFSRITWSHVSTDYGYAYTVRQVSNGAGAGSGTLTPTGAAGSTVTLDFGVNLLSGTLLGNTNYDVVITSFLKTSTGWVSAASVTQRVHTASLLVGLSIQCGGA